MKLLVKYSYIGFAAITLAVIGIILLDNRYIFTASNHYKDINWYFEEPVTVVVENEKIYFESQWEDKFRDYGIIPAIEKILIDGGFYDAIEEGKTVLIKCSRDQYPGKFQPMISYVEYEGVIYLSQGIGIGHIIDHVDSKVSSFLTWYIPLGCGLIMLDIIYLFGTRIFYKKKYLKPAL